jgi:hypothetical protein
MMSKSGFGEAPIKGDGTATNYDKGTGTPPKETMPTTWIEFPVPVHLEAECLKMLDRWLKRKGIQDD